MKYRNVFTPTPAIDTGALYLYYGIITYYPPSRSSGYPLCLVTWHPRSARLLWRGMFYSRQLLQSVSQADCQVDYEIEAEITRSALMRNEHTVDGYDAFERLLNEIDMATSSLLVQGPYVRPTMQPAVVFNELARSEIDDFYRQLQ